ncbi:hypothetical protein XI03_06960 [Bradyrhizobium sp. CCBAU 65884]|nr:hypothetical protein [Bradyrhizobium sp. CCBAU 65884]
MLDLGAALQAARKAYANDHRNKMSRAVLAKHLGHDSLSGPALGKIGALRAYGLIDGNADEIRITNEAVHALEAPEGSPERTAAMSQLAFRPKLFQDIRKDFPGAVSPDNLRFWLIKRDFVPEAAEKAAKTYLATMRLVDSGAQAYNSESDVAPEPLVTPQAPTAAPISPRAPRPEDLAPLSDDQPLVVVMNGERLNIKASVDLEGLKNLREILEKYEGILQMMQKMNPDKKEAAN